LDLAQDELDKAESPIREAKAYRLSNQARIHLLKGEKERAIEASTVAVSILPNDWQVLSTHGLMLIRNNRLQEARTVLDQAISNAEVMNQPPSETHYFRAELFERLGDGKSAQRDLDTASHNKYLPYL
jgi:Tfp pilus assembly protein PilF